MKNRLPAASLIILACAWACVNGQTSSCKVGMHSAASGFWRWAPDAVVKVYVVESDFEEVELSFLLSPLTTWNSVSDATGSKVRFEYKGTTNTPLYCQNCLTIKRGLVFDKSKRHLTELKTYGDPRYQTIIWAKVVVDPLLTKPRTLTNAIAHELGHSFGLLDCYSCKQHSSVMIQFKTVNVSNEMDGPTACDVAQVKATYKILAAQLKQSLQAKKVVDEGEEPVDDDTPIVPKP